MVHISELGAGRRVNHPDEIVTSGQQVQATVLTVEPERRRIGLSLDTDSAPVSADAMQSTPQDDAASGQGSFGDLLKAQLESTPARQSQKGADKQRRR
jgi:small subunit ribosomal protein S1